MYYSIDMNFFYSKDNLVALHSKYDQTRRRFVEWAQNEIAVVPYFHKRILFSDEAHFWLNGYVNKQNCRIWSEANPQVCVETPLHPEKLTVWCILWAGGIIGPYFFKNDEGHNVTVNGDRYRAMVTNFFIPELNNHDVQELWFQQDGATCRTARATIDLLKDTFGDRLISRFGPVNWPPRSCDLTQLDYFLWGYLKSLVYADKPQTIDHLEDNIRRVIADIRPQMLEKVIENWTSRLDYIRASRGSPMPEIIFKINGACINVTLPSYTRAIGDGPRKFESQSKNENVILHFVFTPITHPRSAPERERRAAADRGIVGLQVIAVSISARVDFRDSMRGVIGSNENRNICSIDLELEVNEDDIEELIMGHEDELTTEELQEILNEEHQETQRNVSPSE
ncbi:uncharacterized protein TNCV_5062401 [Trichonephila clavipes]|nr:uncharacterized protein TNCV_5062401 [Trichonephila clavipes]